MPFATMDTVLFVCILYILLYGPIAVRTSPLHYNITKCLTRYDRKDSTLGLWLEIPDVFNNTVEMFNRNSSKYIHLYGTYQSALKSYFSESKIQGFKVSSISNTFVTPKNGTGPILMHFDIIPTRVFYAENVHEQITTFLAERMNVTESSIRHILSRCGCKHGAKILTLTLSDSCLLSNSTPYRRDLDFKFDINVKSKGAIPRVTKVDVKVARISESGHISNFLTLCSEKMFNLTSSKFTCNVAKLGLLNGIRYVVGEARTSEYPEMHGFDYAFINVTVAPLLAKMTVETHQEECYYGLGTRMYLDGSGSYDRNAYSAKEALYYPGDLIYTWFCNISLVLPRSPQEARTFPIVKDGVAITGQTAGCFGSGPGRLNANSIATYFYSTGLSVGQDVKFRLFVEKDNRWKFVDLNCKVVTPPPKFNLDCIYNCDPLMKSTARIAVKAVCDGSAACTDSSLQHSWKGFLDTGRRVDVGEGIVEPVWEPYDPVKNLTETTNLNMVFDEYSFKANRTHRIQFQVKNSEHGIRKAYYNFTTNSLPHSGTCNANQTTLEAFVERVSITCQDWIDEHGINHYEALVMLGSNQKRLLYFGDSSSFNLSLPMGNRSDNFTLRVQIKIFDIYECAIFPMNFMVIKPDADESKILAVLNRDDGNEQAMAQGAIGAMSILDSSVESKSTRTKIREEIISKMIRIPVNDTQSINQVTGALIDSTSKADELSLEGQMQSIKAALNMSESLQNATSTDDPAIFEQVGTTLLHLTGNVLDGTATANTVQSKDTKELGETAVNTCDIIYKTLINKTIGGERTKEFVTPGIGLKFSKMKYNRLPSNYSVHGGSVEISSMLNSLISNSTSCYEECTFADSIVSTKMLFFKNSPYLWSKGKFTVNSPVISLDYFNNHDHAIPVGDLDFEFAIIIPNKSPPKRKNTYDLFLTPGQDCAIHKFNISNNDTAFEIIIDLEQETFVTVFVRYNMRPTEENYDYVFNHPNLSSCVEPPERDNSDNCTGVFDFTECMALNRTSEKLSEKRCENVTVPDVEFLSNASLPRDQKTCIDYHNALACPVVECNLNSSGKSYNNNSLCGNLNYSTSNSKADVCQKVKDFLYCKNARIEKYEECKELLIKKKLIYGKYDYCSQNIYRIFFGLDLFRPAGWYFFSICYPLKHMNTTQTTTTTTTTTTPTRIPTLESNSTASRRKPRRTTKNGKDRKKRSFNTDQFGSILDERRVLIRSRRETTQRKCAVVEEKPAPTTPITPSVRTRVVRPTFDGSSSLNYSFVANLFTCSFWNESKKSWSTYGCKPHRNSSTSATVCLCNHLTSFSAMFVSVNEIDFDKVLKNLPNIGDNLPVLGTIIGLFLLYALAVVFARRADKRDLLLVSKTRVGSIDPSRGGYNYEIAVATGTFRGSGTTANVALTMVGEKGTSQTIPLVDETGSSEAFLSRGNVAYLMVNTPEDIGNIIYIRIWHNNKGNDPAWFMRQITIRDVVSNKKWFFLHNDWFAVDRADGKIDRRIYAASESEKSEFKTLFYSHTAKSFSDKHLWISVILRPPSNPFTRVQRVTCCLSLLLCAMLANAMFYKKGGGSEDTLQVGPFKLSLKQIIIGIESGLIVAPVNILIITLFRKARPKTKKNTKEGDDQESNKHPENKKKNPENTKKKSLPHWCIYIAYLLCAISVPTSATIVILYSMMWGTEKSNEWITSVMLSFIQDIIFLQPLKVIIFATIMSAIPRKPPEDDVEDTYSSETQTEPEPQINERNNLDLELADVNLLTYEPLTSEEVSKTKEYQIRKNTFRSTVREIVWHVLFVLLLSVAVFGSQSSHRFRLRDHLDKVLHKTEKVNASYKFWLWCEDILLPGLYNTSWYNGKDFTDELEGFISSKKAFLIGMPRIRQARVKGEECTGTKEYPKLRKIFPKCYPDYTMSTADYSSLSSSSDNLEMNEETEMNLERNCLVPFKVQSAGKLGALPVVTDEATYSGSGMVADLGYDHSTASKVVLNLKTNKWITRQTRAVFVEFVIFEPATKLYAFVRVSFEQKSIGSMFPSKFIETYALYGTGEASYDSLIFFFQCVFILFILVCLVKEAIKIVKMKILYIKDPWNIFELAMVAFTIIMVTMSFVREIYVRNLIKTIQGNPYGRMSFDYVEYGTGAWKSMASLVVFLATLKLLKLLSFNKKILAFDLVMKLSRPYLVSYTIIFFIVFMAFALFGNLVFGEQMFIYSTVVRSIVNVFQMALGKGLFFRDLKDITSALGPVFILCYFLVTTLLLVNFFVAILNDSYADGCKKIEEEVTEEAIMAAFASAYVKSSLQDISKDLKELQAISRRNRRRKKTLHRQKRRKTEKVVQLGYETSQFLF